MGDALDVAGYVEAEQFEEGGYQVHAAEQLVVDLGRGSDIARGPHDHRDSGACVVKRRLGAWQGRSMVGQENHPGGAVEAGFGEGVEQLADGRVGDGDRAVELGEVLADVPGIGQVVGDGDLVGVRGFIALTRVGPVRLEEARGEQERFVLRISQPCDGVLDDVLTVRVRDVELVKSQPRRIRCLMLHAE